MQLAITLTTLFGEAFADAARQQIDSGVLVKRLPERYGSEQIRWGKEFHEADLVGDVQKYCVLLGATKQATIVGIVEAPSNAQGRSWILPFAHGDEGILCGSQVDVRLVFESPDLPLVELGCGVAVQTPYCEGLRTTNQRILKAMAKGMKGFRLESPNCDAVHVYFDGARFSYWTH